MLLRLTMLPWPLAAIPGANAATRKNGARTLLANILSNEETSNSAVGPKSAIPALLIRMSTSPTSSVVSARPATLRSKGRAAREVSGFADPPGCAFGHDARAFMTLHQRTERPMTEAQDDGTS